MEPVTVSALTTHIVSLFQSDEFLREVYVLGEVSNWKRAASGHVYFSLKDDGASINAVMWRASASSHGWLPDNGDQVIARGYVDVYPDRGAYQLYVNRVQPAGRGQLYARFEALKAKLQEAGLFDVERKRPLPSRVRRIGVVTSADAAALRDILRVLCCALAVGGGRRLPHACAGRGGPGADCGRPGSCRGVTTGSSAKLDVLILARGGGSMEDLWSFNDEAGCLCRGRVAHCPSSVASVTRRTSRLPISWPTNGRLLRRRRRPGSCRTHRRCARSLRVWLRTWPDDCRKT